MAVGVGIAALVAGIAIGWALRRRRPLFDGPDTDRALLESLAAFTDATSPTAKNAQNMRLLSHTVIDLYDTTTDHLVRERILDDLDDAGIHPLTARPGTRFHPSYHLAVDHVRTTDSHKIGTIAALLRPGWTASDCVIRHPEVSVYLPDSRTDQGQLVG